MRMIPAHPGSPPWWAIASSIVTCRSDQASRASPIALGGISGTNALMCDANVEHGCGPVGMDAKDRRFDPSDRVTAAMGLGQSYEVAPSHLLMITRGATSKPRCS
jgi:hypothetical protein